MARDSLQAEQQQIQQKLSDPAVLGDRAEVARLSKRNKEVETLLALHDEIERAEAEIKELGTALASSDAELASMAETELPTQQARLETSQKQLKELERPRDPNDEKDIIVEIRAGAGGDEASLFARELYGMYQRYSEQQGWTVELLSSSTSEVGGYKELIVSIKGAGAYGKLKYEAGTHRVQRIPVTESGGRVHTSTVTVVVLPEAEEVEVDIKPEDIRIDVFRSSGPGGQSVNTTDSAVRITHLSTGLVVSCQDEKSQHKNRERALSILRARLKAQQEAAAAKERGDQRRTQVGTGDRSEKIRTYNFPQDRVTDHRAGITRHGLDKLLSGELDELLSEVAAALEEEREPDS